jgi:antitoxin HigA-1
MRSKLLTTTRKKEPERLLPLVTPGEILWEEFMKPFGLPMNALAKELDVPANRIMAILRTQRSITADTSLRLARYFGTSAEFWMNLQRNYDLGIARRQKLEEIEQKVIRRLLLSRNQRSRRDARNRAGIEGWSLHTMNPSISYVAG